MRTTKFDIDKIVKTSFGWIIRIFCYIIAPFFLCAIVHCRAASYLTNDSTDAEIQTVNMIKKMSWIAIIFFIWFLTKKDYKYKYFKSDRVSFSVAIFWVCLRIVLCMISGIYLSSKHSQPNEALSVVSFINTVILAPISEELLFRMLALGIVNSALPKDCPRTARNAILFISLLISAIGFSCYHFMPKDFSADLFVKYFLAGILYGFAYLKSNNLIYPLLMHFFNNLTNFFLNEKLFYEWSPIIPVVCAILASIIAISIFLKKETGEDITRREESTYKEKGS